MHPLGNTVSACDSLGWRVNMVSPMSPMYRTAPSFGFSQDNRFPPLQTPSSPDKASSLKGWDPATTASPGTRKTLLDLQSREQAAKQRVNKLQRELHKIDGGAHEPS